MNSISFNPDEMTRIQWMGITILEPVTVITNLIMTMVCLYAYFKLKNLEYPNHLQKLARYFFLIMAFSTAIGGILGHGFLYVIGYYGKLPGWFISMLAIAVFERVAIIHARPLMPGIWANFFSIFNYLEITAFMILAFITLNFRFVEMHAAYGLFVVVFSFEMYTYKKQKDRGSVYIIYGTLLGILAAITHMFKIGIHTWFNYNDVSHMIMAGGIYFYYQGSLNLKVYGQPQKTGSPLFYKT